MITNAKLEISASIRHVTSFYPSDQLDLLDRVSLLGYSVEQVQVDILAFSVVRAAVAAPAGIHTGQFKDLVLSLHEARV